MHMRCSLYFIAFTWCLCIICFAKLADAATSERVAKDLTITSFGTSPWPQIYPSASKCIGWPQFDPIVSKGI